MPRKQRKKEKEEKTWADSIAQRIANEIDAQLLEELRNMSIDKNGNVDLHTTILSEPMEYNIPEKDK